MNCKFCNKECANINSKKNHERFCKENPDRQDRSGINNPRYGKTAWNKGLTKETDERVKQYGETFKRRLNSGEFTFYYKGKTLSEDVRKKISLSMKEAHKEKRAWHIGTNIWKKEPSFPEKFFMELVEKFFEDKNYTKEYRIKKFILDFAWIDKKRCIEIDGEQHQRFSEVIERDARKDKFLGGIGWSVLRVSWKQLSEDTEKTMCICKNFIDKE